MRGRVPFRSCTSPRVLRVYLPMIIPWSHVVHTELVSVSTDGPNLGKSESKVGNGINKIKIKSPSYAGVRRNRTQVHFLLPSVSVKPDWVRACGPAPIPSA
jgi:hypothetical protein